MQSRNRVFLYITNGTQLLVLSHVDYPDLGLQIPGGTIEADESPADAALREGFEETGIEGLRIAALLGTSTQDMTAFGRKEVLHCWYYHLIADGPQPARWRHSELDPSDGEEQSILFELFWKSMNEPLDLGGIDDRFMPELRRSSQKLCARR